MSKTIEDKILISWDEFKEIASSLNKEEEKEAKETKDPLHIRGQWLFRGQSNCDWGLKTSLERYLEQELNKKNSSCSVYDYYDFIDHAIPTINSLLGKNFERIPLLKEEVIPFFSLPHYQLLSWLRHFSFPSPLLDWSESFYIAAFFAFRNAQPSTHPAVFAFKASRMRSFGGGQAVINDLGPFVESHPRHFKQQSRYTVCIRKNSQDKASFVGHENAIKQTSQNQEIKKYVLNIKERRHALKELEQMNINDYTLFGSEESLMKAIANKYAESLLD